MAVGLLLLSLTVIILVIKVAPEKLANTTGLGREQQAQEVGRVRTATLALLAGAIAFVGAMYTARTYRLNQRGQITDRFIRAVAQLGDDSLDVRIGGVFALERVAYESEMEHGPVMEVLAAFVRERSLVSAAIGRANADVLAAMTVLERRNRALDVPGVELDLSGANLSYLKLRPGADFRSMTFGQATLAYALLPRADLTGVNLRGADLSYAQLDGARLMGAQLFASQLVRTQLTGADLRQAKLAGARLHKAYLGGAKLAGADFKSFDGLDRQGDLVSFAPADLGVDGTADAAVLTEATYDDATAWPNWPPGLFDPSARGARRV